MKTEPTIPRQQIRQHINKNYPVNVDTLEFLPIGEGAWCFRGSGDRELFIRLVKDIQAEERAARLSKSLHAEKLPVLVPLPDKLGNLISAIDGNGISVYPFIRGATLMELVEGSLSDEEASRIRQEIGLLIARLHSVESSKLALLGTEDFCKFQEESVAIIRWENRQNDDLLASELSDFLNARSGELENLIAVTRKLAQKLRSQKLDYVVCHGDIHEANVMVSDESELFLIDWDNAIRGPKERDLTFFHGDGLSDYLKGYFGDDRQYQIHQAIVDYYVLEWALQEIVDYGTRVLSDIRFDTDGRMDAWQQFQRLFEPGQDVDVALTLVREMRM